MFKIRMHASRLAGARLGRRGHARSPNAQRPIFFRKSAPEKGTVETILTTPEPWFEQDTGRLEYVNRIKLWRYLTDDAELRRRLLADAAGDRRGRHPRLK